MQEGGSVLMDAFLIDLLFIYSLRINNSAHFNII